MVDIAVAVAAVSCVVVPEFLELLENVVELFSSTVCVEPDSSGGVSIPNGYLHSGYGSRRSRKRRKKRRCCHDLLGSWTLSGFASLCAKNNVPLFCPDEPDDFLELANYERPNEICEAYLSHLVRYEMNTTILLLMKTVFIPTKVLNKIGWIYGINDIIRTRNQTIVKYFRSIQNEDSLIYALNVIFRHHEQLCPTHHFRKLYLWIIAFLSDRKRLQMCNSPRIIDFLVDFLGSCLKYRYNSDTWALINQVYLCLYKNAVKQGNVPLH